MLSSITSIFIILFGAWLLFSLFLWLAQDSMIFYPKSLDHEQKNNLQQYEFSFATKDSNQLVGWYIPNNESELAIIYFGGNSEEISNSLLDLKSLTSISAAGFNYRGYGESKGKASAHHLRNDAIEVFDQLVKHSKIDENNWVVLGRSLGSHMATLVANQRNVRGLILVTPYDSITEVAARMYKLFPVRYLLKHHFNTVAETNNIAAPTLIIKSEVDYTIPHSSTQRLVKQWQSNTKIDQIIISNTSHGDISHSKEYWQEINKFITSLN